MKKKIYSLVAFSLSSLGLFASNPPSGSWTMYFGTYQLKDSKFRASYDIQYRTHELFNDLNQLLIRGAIQYKINPNITTGIGYAFVQTEAFGEPDLPFKENRIFQEVLTQQQIFENVPLKQRFRWEQRFIENADFRTRLRHQMTIDVPFYQFEKDKQFLYATAYNELFINTDKSRKTNVFERNRLYTGLGYKHNSNLSFQLGWMNQMLQKQSYQQWMISVHHTL